MTIKKKTNRKTKKPLAYVNSDYLSLLGKTKNKKKRDILIDIATNDQLKAILECIFNILDGSVLLSKTHIDKLKKHKSVLRKHRNDKLSTEQRKLLLKQKGGFLNVLLPIASGILGSILGGGK